MAKGYIYGDRYALKWQAEGKKLFARIWSKGGIRLKKNTIFGRPKTESFVCNTCEVITIDLKTQKPKTKIYFTVSLTTSNQNFLDFYPLIRQTSF